jgi:dihydrofolate reductase
MTDQPDPSTEIAITAVLSPEIERAFSQMVTAIPEDDDNAMDDILATIMGSATWEDLNKAWESAKGERLAGRILRIDTVTRHDSDFAESLGFFLVAKGVDTKTGETFAWPTGSVGTMAQLARAYLSGWLPLFAEVIIAERPTKKGYRPQHLQFHGKA